MYRDSWKLGLAEPSLPGRSTSGERNDWHQATLRNRDVDRLLKSTRVEDDGPRH